MYHNGVELSEKSYVFPSTKTLLSMQKGEFRSGPILRSTISENIDEKINSEESFDMRFSKSWAWYGSILNRTQSVIIIILQIVH